MCPLDEGVRSDQVRLADTQFLFDEWRDPRLTGVESIQRTLDGASHHNLPISKAG